MESVFKKLPDEILCIIMRFLTNSARDNISKANIDVSHILGTQTVTNRDEFFNLCLNGENFINNTLRRGYQEQINGPDQTAGYFKKLSPITVFNISTYLHTQTGIIGQNIPIMEQDENSRLDKMSCVANEIKNKWKRSAYKFLKESHSNDFMLLNKWLKLLDNCGFSDAQANLAVAFTYLLSAHDPKLQMHLPRLRLMITEMLLRYRVERPKESMTQRAEEIFDMLNQTHAIPAIAEIQLDLPKLYSLGIVSLFSNEQTLEILDLYMQARMEKNKDANVLILPVLFRMSATYPIFSYNSRCIMQVKKNRSFPIVCKKNSPARIPSLYKGRELSDLPRSPLAFLNGVMREQFHNQVHENETKKIAIEIPVIDFNNLPVHPGDDGNIEEIYSGAILLDDLENVIGCTLPAIRDLSSRNYADSTYARLTEEAMNKIFKEQQ